MAKNSITDYVEDFLARAYPEYGRYRDAKADTIKNQDAGNLTTTAVCERNRFGGSPFRTLEAQGKAERVKGKKGCWIYVPRPKRRTVSQFQA